MSVAQPKFMYTFDAFSSGDVFTEYGTATTPYEIQQGVITTNYTINPTGGQYGSGELDVLTKSGGSQVYATTAETAPGTSTNSINFFCAFDLDSLSTSNNSRLISKSGTGTTGDVNVYTTTPTSNDFNLIVEVESSGGETLRYTYQSLLFNTSYKLCVTLDFTTASAVVGRCRLNADAQTMTAVVGDNDWTGETIGANWPLMFRRSDFPNHFGVDGQFSAWVYDRTTTPWETTDHASIIADPAFIDGWPSSSGSASPMGGPFGRLLRGKL